MIGPPSNGKRLLVGSGPATGPARLRWSTGVPGVHGLSGLKRACLKCRRVGTMNAPPVARTGFRQADRSVATAA